jgi:hypothetical protein
MPIAAKAIRVVLWEYLAIIYLHEIKGEYFLFGAGSIRLLMFYSLSFSFSF